MDQSVLLGGGLAVIATLVIIVSIQIIGFPEDEDPFILVLRAEGHLSRCAPWRRRKRWVRDVSHPFV